MISSESPELLEDSSSDDDDDDDESCSDEKSSSSDDEDGDDSRVAGLLPAFLLDIVFFLLALAGAALDFLFRVGGLRFDVPSDSSATPKYVRASSASKERQWLASHRLSMCFLISFLASTAVSLLSGQELAASNRLSATRQIFFRCASSSSVSLVFCLVLRTLDVS